VSANPFPFLDDDDPRTQAEREEDAREDEARDRMVGFLVFAAVGLAVVVALSYASRWFS
jgi:hypothetical protein